MNNAENVLSFADIEGMEKAADAKKAEINNIITAMQKELSDLNALKEDVMDPDEFTKLVGKIASLETAIMLKKKTLDTVHPEYCDVDLVRCWEKYITSYSDEMHELLIDYEMSKRKLYESFIDILERQNSMLMTKTQLENRMKNKRNLFVDRSIFCEEYNESAARFFDSIIQQGDYFENDLGVISIWHKPNNLRNAPKVGMNRNQRYDFYY